MQLRFMSPEGLFIAATTGAMMGVGWGILQRKEKGNSEDDDIAGVGRSAIGGA